VWNVASGAAAREEFMFDSPIHWMVVAVVILVLFGGRKIPELMRGLGEGVRGFREGMTGSGPSATPPPAQPSAATPEKPAEDKK
jgi:sec-independent protein translocase protein TatA